MDEAYGIAVDKGGNAYVTGRTTSTEATFPKTAGPDLTFNGGVDAFAAKVNPAGSALGFAGYIGGTGEDEGFGVAVDGAGYAVVPGRTTSNEASFPKANAWDLTLGGNADGFLACVNTSGVNLVFAGYVGGSGLEEGFGTAYSAARQIYVPGRSLTGDGSFTTLNGPAL
ncbi:MAG: SBBP repeat-containing protein, partial [Blastocatellia bacterium]